MSARTQVNGSPISIGYNDVITVNFTNADTLEELFQLVAQLGRVKIVLSFGNIPELSYHIIGNLIILNRKIKNEGGRLILCNMAQKIEEVLKVTKLNSVFEIAKNEQEALSLFGR